MPNVRLFPTATLFFCLFCVATKGNEILEINKILVNHRPITLPLATQTIHLVSSNNDILLEFKHLQGDSIYYQHQLKNYERDFTITNFPVARYMNLSDGKYDFVIKAFDKKTQIANYILQFNVEKSISEVWWFYPMIAFYVLLLAVGGIYLFFLYNFRQKMKVLNLRTKIASDLHDEVGSTLSSIALSANFVSNKLQNQNADIRQILGQIKKDSEETVHTIRDTVWALNPDNDSIENLIEKIRSFALQILTAKEIKLNFDNKISEAKTFKISVEQRKNLFLIIKESITNIAKHAEATEVKIAFERKKELLKINISDNGKGFDTQQLHEGNGLHNLQKRAKESHFELKINSGKGKGTNIYVETLTI